MAVKKLQDLDPNKVKQAVDKYGEESVRNRIRKAWLIPKQEAIKPTTWVGATTWVKPTWDLLKAQWYQEWQVWIEWVNLYRKQQDTLTDQQKEAISWKFKEDATKTDTTGVTQKEVSWYEQLEWDVLNDRITELQKKVASWQVEAEELAETQRQLEYYESAKRDEDYLTKQRERQKQVDTITWEISDIQSSQRLRQARQSLKTMKANIAYLWNMWRPWQSAVKLDAISDQIAEWDRVYNELVTIEDKYKQARKLWEESKAAQFERQMDDLQRDLDDNVNQTLQDALWEIDKAELDWLIRNEEEMEKFKEMIFQNVDLTVAEISDRQWRKMNDLLAIAQDDLNRTKEYQANKSKIEAIPNAMWWVDYMDANGEYLLDASWNRISSVESPMDPIIDMDKGIMVTFSTDEMWNIVSQTHQLLDQPTFAEQTLQNYATMHANGKLSINEMQSMWLSPDQIQKVVSQSAWITPTVSEEQEWTKLTDDILYNKLTWETKNVKTWEVTWAFSKDVQAIVDYSTQRRGRTSLQCGELVNDYWTKTTWSAAWMWDTLDSKVDALLNAGLSDNPIAWWLFVSNPLWNEVWHTGIVQSVNPDGSITVLEANPQWRETGSYPVTRTYTAEQMQNMYFSNPPLKQPTEMVDKPSIPDFERFLKSGTLTWPDSERLIEEFGSIEEFKRQAEAYNNSPWWPREQELRQVKEVRDILNTLVENEEQAENVSWTVQISPWDSLTKKKQTYLWKLQNFIDKQTLQNLIDAKAAGATFWALSNEELKMLQNSAQILSTYAVRDEDDKIIWFNVDEASFKAELQAMLDKYDQKIEEKEKMMWKIEWVLYTDEEWIEYDKDTLLKEIERQVAEWLATEDQVMNWLEQNNLSHILD